MKSSRILEIYDKLLNNENIDIDKLALKENKSRRTIERDIADIKNYLQSKSEGVECVFNKKKKNYILNDSINKKLTKSEALAVSKILLDSRAFLKGEMEALIDKIIKQCTSAEDYKALENMVKNEKFHYIELKHKKSFIENIYDLGLAVRNKNKLKIKYKKTQGEIVERIIYPVGLMFSEFYFYLLGHIENADKEKFENKDDIFPTIYRVDRIEKFAILKEHFKNIYYNTRFEEGKFRKRIHFMTGGKLRRVRFIYRGDSLEAVLDKIPTARVIKELKLENSKEEYLIEAEVFGNGFDRWLRSQGKDVLVNPDVIF